MNDVTQISTTIITEKDKSDPDNKLVIVGVKIQWKGRSLFYWMKLERDKEHTDNDLIAACFSEILLQSFKRPVIKLDKDDAPITLFKSAWPENVHPWDAEQLGPMYRDETMMS